MMNDKIEMCCNENNSSYVIMKAVILFLAIFTPITLVKRILSLVLTAAGIDNKNINSLTGYGESTIRKLKSDMCKKAFQKFLRYSHQSVILLQPKYAIGCEKSHRNNPEKPYTSSRIMQDTKSVPLFRHWQKELRIILTYIPPHSSNLNLIERVWKFVRAELRSKYYDNFSAFQTKIDSIIGSTSKGNLAKIKRLILEKIQLFDDMKPITENTFECSDKRLIQVAQFC